MKLLIATKNPGKAEEILAGLSDLPLEILTLADLDLDTDDFEEMGDTFLMNSFLKANYYYNATKLPTVADDSGLAVDHLGGEPGVKSRRWPGYEATDEELMTLLLERLKGVAPERRTAHFIAAVSFIFDPQNTYTTEHRVSGRILEKPHEPVKSGLPWSSLFIADGFDRPYSQLSKEEKSAISHRGGAIKKIKPFIIKHASYARH